MVAIKIRSKQTDIFMIQLYMQTSSYKNDKIEEIYLQISGVLEMIKKKNNLIKLKIGTRL